MILLFKNEFFSVTWTLIRTACRNHEVSAKNRHCCVVEILFSVTVIVWHFEKAPLIKKNVFMINFPLRSYYLGQNVPYFGKQDTRRP